MSESLIRRLGELPVAEPDIRRAEHIRKRCHAHLARQKRRGLVSSRPTAERMVLVWQSLIAVLGFVYLTQAIRFALDVYGLT
jgi:hypothetical protein